MPTLKLRERGFVPYAAGSERAFSVKSTPASAPKFLPVLTGRIATFTIGLIAGLFLFGLINYRTVEYPPFIDGTGHTGWPFRFYTFGGWAGMSIINWPFLLGDALVGLIMSVGMAILFTAIYRLLEKQPNRVEKNTLSSDGSEQKVGCVGEPLKRSLMRSHLWADES